MTAGVVRRLPVTVADRLRPRLPSNLALNRVESVELIRAAAVAHTGLSGVELHGSAGHPTLAFIGADTELPERMRRRVTQTISVPAVDGRSLLSGIDLL